jgi:hypothetical protein
MATIIPSRFALKSIHEEIDLFDRKLAHAEKYGAFVSDKEREAAVNKLLTKRQQLVRSAQQMIEEGIEFKPSELPRSLRPVPEEAQP